MNKIFTIYKNSFQGLSKDVYIFAFIMLINRIGTLILPFLTLYTTQQLGWTKIDAGTATMWFGIGSLAGALIGGEMTGKIGYYWTMIISLITSGIVFYLLQFITEFYMLCGFLFLSSLLADLMRPALWTGLTFFTSKENQTRSVSLLRMAFNAGIAIGPAIAGAFIISQGYRVIFILDSITCILAAIFLLLLVKNRSAKVEVNTTIEPVGKSPYQDGLFMGFMGLNLLMLVSFFQILFTVPLFMNEVLGCSEKEVGFFFTANGLLILLLELPLVYYMENFYSKFRSMIIGMVLLGMSVLIFIFPVSAIVMLIFYTFFVTVGEIINFPFISSASMDRATKGNMGRYMAVTTVLFSVSLIIAPKFGTWVLDAFGYVVLFIVLFLMCMIGAAGLWWMQDRFERTEQA